ncbi:hypothetical protein ON010_g7765 [Phytophthora cinnamomi]|nr:hypothetical protein ON010_g7765 [Phytophthora cinnamomi]
MRFKVTSWCFDDYKKAILKDDFFRNVVAMLPPYPTQSDPEKEATERIKLLRAKYFMAGGSARLMFDVTTAMAIEILKRAFRQAPNIETYLHGLLAIRHLLPSVYLHVDGPTWMAPVKWNQGGYDAVFIDKTEQLVRFVQVTRPECHTFDEKYFIDLLKRLVAGDLNKVAVVELCFGVPMAWLETFSLPVGKEAFKKIVVEVALSPS